MTSDVLKGVTAPVVPETLNKRLCVLSFRPHSQTQEVPWSGLSHFTVGNLRHTETQLLTQGCPRMGWSLDPENLKSETGTCDHDKGGVRELER